MDGPITVQLSPSARDRFGELSAAAVPANTSRRASLRVTGAAPRHVAPIRQQDGRRPADRSSRGRGGELQFGESLLRRWPGEWAGGRQESGSVPSIGTTVDPPPPSRPAAPAAGADTSFTSASVRPGAAHQLTRRPNANGIDAQRLSSNSFPAAAPNKSISEKTALRFRNNQTQAIDLLLGNYACFQA